jgi:dihydroxyacetone kinase phosphotransfer subunit
MVNLVIVSHSARLGEGVGELARQMLMGDGCKLAIAAGIDDPENPIGTDPIKVMEAIESVADTDHVLVMMDIGSALLSAETALDLLDPAIAAKVRLCAAPLVEGTLAATVSAASGSDIDKVIADAMSALEAKRVQLGLPSLAQNGPEATPMADDLSGESVSVVIKNHNGLHVRPASRLVAALSGFNAELVLEKGGKCVSPDSINQIALLQVRCNDTLRLLARGPDAEAALAAFQALAAENFGELPDAAPAVFTPPVSRVQGKALRYPLPALRPVRQTGADIASEQRRLQQAFGQTLDDLNALTTLAEERYSADIAAIFPATTRCSTTRISMKPPAISCARNNAMRSGRGIRCWPISASSIASWTMPICRRAILMSTICCTGLCAICKAAAKSRWRCMSRRLSSPTISFLPASCSWILAWSRGSVCGQEARHLTARSSPVRPGSSTCASREMPCSRYAMVNPLRWMSPENA